MIPARRKLELRRRAARARAHDTGASASPTRSCECPSPSVLVPGGRGQPTAAGRRRGPRLAARRRDEPEPGRPRSAPGRWSSARRGSSTASRRPATGLPRSRLDELGADPVGERVVEDGKIVTAAGVSAGIDLALELAAPSRRRSGGAAIQLGIGTTRDPPFDAGSPAQGADRAVDLDPQSGRAQRRRRHRAAQTETDADRVQIVERLAHELGLEHRSRLPVSSSSSRRRASGRSARSPRHRGGSGSTPTCRTAAS